MTISPENPKFLAALCVQHGHSGSLAYYPTGNRQLLFMAYAFYFDCIVCSLGGEHSPTYWRTMLERIEKIWKELVIEKRDKAQVLQARIADCDYTVASAKPRDAFLAVTSEVSFDGRKYFAQMTVEPANNAQALLEMAKGSEVVLYDILRTEPTTENVLLLSVLISQCSLYIEKGSKISAEDFGNAVNLAVANVHESVREDIEAARNNTDE